MEENNKIDELEEEFEEEKSRLRLKYSIVIFIVAIVVAVFSSEITLNYYLKQLANPKLEESSSNPVQNINNIAENLKEFRKVIDSVYIGEIDENKMMDETIKGYVNGLGDEYSEYMNKEEWEEFQSDALGNYVGIGILMSMTKDGGVIILSVFEDSPAEEAGLLPGDIIVGVNDESILGKDSEYAASVVKGEEGKKVKLSILRDRTDKKEFEIERRAIKVDHVPSEMIEKDIGYIELATFDDGCSVEFKNAYDELKNKGAKKVIIDLRNNTGGIVDEALAIIDYFVPKDETVLITVDASGNKQFTKAQIDKMYNEEIVVLVNEYSASASEILVGALRDNGCLKAIVGTKTYGKGVIQSVFKLSNEGVLKITTEEYYTPNENKINKVGIEPTVEIEEGEDELTDGKYDRNKDVQFQKALEIIKSN